MEIGREIYIQRFLIILEVFNGYEKYDYFIFSVSVLQFFYFRKIIEGFFFKYCAYLGKKWIKY